MFDIFTSKKLKEEIEGLKQNYKFLEEKFEKEKKDRTRALNDLYLKSKETDLLKSKCEILEEDKVKLEKEVSNLKGKNLSLQAEAEETKLNLEESISNLQTKNFALEDELKEEKVRLIRAIRLTKAISEKKVSLEEELKEEKAKFEKKISDLQVTNFVLEEELEEEKSRLTKKISDLNEKKLS